MKTYAERRAALQRAQLYVCTDSRAHRGDLEEFLHAAYAGGVDIIQLRDKRISVQEELAALRILAGVAAEHGKLFAVNDRADVAAVVGADILHTGQSDLSARQARQVVGPEVLLGRSNNSVEQFRQSYLDPEVAYAVIGPVWPTPTKPGRPAVGLDVVSEAAALASSAGTDLDEHVQKPWFAIGGIDAATVGEVRGVGAERVVVVRAVTDAADPAAAAHDLRTALAVF